MSVAKGKCTLSEVSFYDNAYKLHDEKSLYFSSYNYYKVTFFRLYSKNKNLKDDKHLLVSFCSKPSKIGHFRPIFSKK